MDDTRLSSLEEDFLTAIGKDCVYGLELMERINKARVPFGFKSLGVGSLYTALARLVSAGLLDREDGEDNRVYYELTYDGHKVLSNCQAYRDLLTQLAEEHPPGGRE